MKRKLTTATMLFAIMFSLLMVGKTDSYAWNHSWIRYELDISQISSFKLKKNVLEITLDDNDKLWELNKKVNKSPYLIHRDSLKFKLTKKTRWTIFKGDFESIHKRTYYKDCKDVRKIFQTERKKYLSYLKRDNLMPSEKSSESYFDYRCKNNTIHKYHRICLMAKKGTLKRVLVSNYDN